MKVMDENKNAQDDYKYGNNGLKDPGRRGRRRPGEPCPVVPLNVASINGRFIVIFS